MTIISTLEVANPHMFTTEKKLTMHEVLRYIGRAKMQGRIGLYLPGKKNGFSAIFTGACELDCGLTL